MTRLAEKVRSNNLNLAGPSLSCVHLCTDGLAISVFQFWTSGTRNAMADYRAYIIGADGHFIRAVEFVCPDDETAKEYARRLVDGHDMELWQGDWHIANFEHKPK